MTPRTFESYEFDDVHGPPAPNLDLLEKVMSHVEQLDAFTLEGVSLDQTWRQGTWRRISRDPFALDGSRCQTALCFAGWTAELTNTPWVTSDFRASEVELLYVVNADGDHEPVSRYAQRALGLTACQAADLFDGGNDLDELRDFVGKLRDAWVKEDDR